MNALTPFSGLSLIVHLLIIGMAAVIKKVGKKGLKIFHTPTRVPTLWIRYRLVVLQSISICVIIIIGFGISASTAVAVRTGLREGALESHSEYILKRYVYLQEVGKNLGEWNESVLTIREKALIDHTAVNSINNILQSTAIDTNDSYTSISSQFSLIRLTIPDQAFNPLP